MENYTIADTSAPLSFFDKNGYYTVGNKIFNHKIYALQEASRTRQNVKWNFNDEVFGNVNWKQSTNIPLRELYRMRAQQLRAKYKYIICAWSGGGDSTTMCEAFLENGIHLDEIITLWPLTLSDGKYTPNSKDTSNLNMPSEFDFSVKPRIELWKQLYPNQKITVADTCEILKDEYLDDTVRIVEKHSYLTIQRWRHQDKILQERIDQHGDSVCVVHGVSPLEFVLLDDYASVKFVDNLAGAGVKSDYTLSGMARHVEYFYWAKDLPEIMIQQAHDIYDSIKVDQTNRRYFHQMAMQPDRSFKMIHSPDYEMNRRYKKKIIYPKYPWDWFQVEKQDRTHEAGTWESWFENNPHSAEFTTAHASAITAHINLIDDKFKIFHNGKLSNYVPFQTPFYVIGKLPSVDMSKIFPQKIPDGPGIYNSTRILNPYSMGL
jgi:hypothetical protein